MSTADIREKLHQYIERADDKKIKAIYTIVGGEESTPLAKYDEAFIAELERRTDEIKNGTAKTYTWEEVQQRAKRSLKKASKNK